MFKIKKMPAPQTTICRILLRCHKRPYPAMFTEMEKWSWIRIRNAISTKIELVLHVHPLVPRTKFGGDRWTRSWDILRTNTVRTDTQTHADDQKTLRPTARM